MEALNQVLNTQMATQQTQPTRQMEAQIRQLAVVLEMDAQRTQSTQETRQVEASDQVLSAKFICVVRQGRVCLFHSETFRWQGTRIKVISSSSLKVRAMSTPLNTMHSSQLKSEVIMKSKQYQDEVKSKWQQIW